jgi:hypothetical protein
VALILMPPPGPTSDALAAWKAERLRGVSPPTAVVVAVCIAAEPAAPRRREEPSTDAA